MAGRSSSGRPDVSGASAAPLAGAPVGSVTLLTLSQLASISTPPASLKLTSLPSRADCARAGGAPPRQRCAPASGRAPASRGAARACTQRRRLLPVCELQGLARVPARQLRGRPGQVGRTRGGTHAAQEGSGRLARGAALRLAGTGAVLLQAAHQARTLVPPERRSPARQADGRGARACMHR